MLWGYHMKYSMGSILQPGQISISSWVISRGKSGPFCFSCLSLLSERLCATLCSPVTPLNLDLVLLVLQKSLFGPLRNITLSIMTHKVAFLVTCVRRISKQLFPLKSFSWCYAGKRLFRGLFIPMWFPPFFETWRLFFHLYFLLHNIPGKCLSIVCMSCVSLPLSYSYQYFQVH